jgi:hypothetical protein
MAVNPGCCAILTVLRERLRASFEVEPQRRWTELTRMGNEKLRGQLVAVGRENTTGIARKRQVQVVST